MEIGCLRCHKGQQCILDSGESPSKVFNTINLGRFPKQEANRQAANAGLNGLFCCSRAFFETQNQDENKNCSGTFK